eukprot:GHVS01044348.1.p1 GENE.GHVS01044348.1~~GHVS01044348.1.p1  ORF type:complete len:257 (-),score=34.68 GHVS01044348.1:6-776(-)
MDTMASSQTGLRARALGRRERLAATATSRLAGLLGHTQPSATTSPPPPLPPFSLLTGLFFRIRFLGHVAIGVVLPLVLLYSTPRRTFSVVTCLPLLVLCWDLFIWLLSRIPRDPCNVRSPPAVRIWKGLSKLVVSFSSYAVHVLFAVSCFCVAHFLLLCLLQFNIIWAVDNMTALHRLFSSSIIFPPPPDHPPSSPLAPPSSSSWRALSAWNSLRLSQAASVSIAKALFAFADLFGACWWPVDHAASLPIQQDVFM